MSEDFTLLHWGLLAASGLFSGCINVMAGGGSMLTLPALMLLGLPAELANGTNRFSIITQSAAGVRQLARAGQLDRKILLPAFVPTVLGALTGAYVVTHWVPRSVIKPVLLITMLAIATLMVLPRPSRRVVEPTAESSARIGWASWLGLFGAGVYGGFVQAGVGLVLLTVLNGMLGYGLVRANAIKLACAGLLGVAALGVFVSAGQVVWVPALVLGATAAVGALIGVKLMLRVDPRLLRWVVFAVVVVLAGSALLTR